MLACLRLVILFLAAAFAAASASAETRVALVIGNGAYQYADKLANPVRDARNIRSKLEKLGFQVIFGEDLDKRSLERAIGRFAGAAKEADVALVYFAGHGATFGDTSYVVPTDARFLSLEDVPYELVPLEEMIGELRRAKGVRIAILDACRDDATERKLKRASARGGEITRGLAPVHNPDGLIVAYATQYLETAADGDPNGDSPFTAALLDNLATPGLDVKDMFFKVARQVIAKTRGHQRPEISVSFYDSYALAPSAAVVAPTAPPIASAGPGPDQVAWSAIEASATAQQIAVLIQKFPSSPLLPVWEKRLVELAALIPPPAAAVAGGCDGVTLASLQRRTAAPLLREEECALKPKDEFRECTDCPAMVVVPPGAFTMGSPESEQGRSTDEGPQHDVTIGRAFAVGKHAVTFDEWDVCVADGGCNGYRPDDSAWGRGNRPVINVSWSDAQAYVAWLSRTTGKNYRLLSEAEWEYAARAGTQTAYPWGGKLGKNKANCDGCGSQWGGKKTAPVGSFPPNGFGLYDMVGNVWAWVQDCYHENYDGAPRDGAAWTALDCSRRVLRGGAWNDDPRDLRTAYRRGDDPTNRFDLFGFRLARTLNP